MEAKTPTEAVAEEAAKIDPSFGTLVRSGVGWRASFFLLMPVAIKQCTVDVELDAIELIDQLRDRSPSEIIEAVTQKE